MKKMTRIAFSALLSGELLAVIPLSAQTPPAKQWDVDFGGTYHEEFRCLQQTADEGYILGGSSLSGISGDKTQAGKGDVDFWIVKADAAGSKQWDLDFGGKRDDYLNALQQTSDGGYIFGGRSISGFSGDKTQPGQGDFDFWVIKTNEAGEKQWNKSYGGTGKDELWSVQQTDDGGYIFGGASNSPVSGDKTQGTQGGYDYWIVKTDNNGLKQWDARFGGTGDDLILTAQQTADGGYILGGQSFSGLGGDKTQPSYGNYDFWIVKTNSSGVKQWDATFGGTITDVLRDLDQTADGGYILGGYSNSPVSGTVSQVGKGRDDYWIVKINANGEKQWDTRYGGSQDDDLSAIQQTADGGYILGGDSYSRINGDKSQANNGAYDYWVVKTDENGVKEWDADFGGGKLDLLYDIEQTVDGGYILGGGSQSGINGNKTQATKGGNDYWIVKLAPEEGLFKPTHLNPGNSGEKSVSGTMIYPNPTNGKFTLNLYLEEEGNEPAIIEIINNFGQVVYAEKVAIENKLLKKEISLDHSLAQGIYLVKVMVNNKVYSSQIVYRK